MTGKGVVSPLPHSLHLGIWVSEARPFSHFSCALLCVIPQMAATRLPRLWDSPGKNTGVGCHFLLQCVKVKSESEVAQSCPTLSDPMDCSLPGSSVHGIFQARVLEWGAIAFSDCFLGRPQSTDSMRSLRSISTQRIYRFPPYFLLLQNLPFPLYLPL